MQTLTFPHSNVVIADAPVRADADLVLVSPPMREEGVSPMAHGGEVAAWAQDAKQRLRPGGSLFVIGGETGIIEFTLLCEDWTVKRIAWVRDVDGAPYHDTILWACPNPCLLTACHPLTGAVEDGDIWEIPFGSEDLGLDGQKPVSLYMRIIELNSKIGDTVYVPFGGNGSTALAAVRTGRNITIVDPDQRQRDTVVARLTGTIGSIIDA
jgi:DNA modification methylase